ncbi:MAG: SpoIIE family protein phosphatase [Bryobacteraceae bacterium]
MNTFLDIAGETLNKKGEELCGDAFKAVRLADRSIVVLADGMGSGVKANILATLTTEIVLAMSKMDRPLGEIIETIAGTLPVSADRKIAYATFTIVEVRHSDWSFSIVNYDNPRPFFFRSGRLAAVETDVRDERGKRIEFQQGTFLPGDFLGVMTDGLIHAGPGLLVNLQADWEFMGHYIEKMLVRLPNLTRSIVHNVMRETRSLYGNGAGDDATFIGIHLRNRNSLMVFTGPPTDPADDEACARKLLDFDGAKVICGGTTGTIVANYLGEPIRTDASTERKDIPPIADIRGIDLVTEGIYTLAGALEYLKACGGDPFRLPGDRNGAILLASELLRADFTRFLVGQAVNPSYQNPLLPKNISIRRSLVDELAKFLREINKEVVVEYR